MEQLIKQIEQWASDRNIIKGSKPIDQAMKLFSEFGELADNVGKGRDCRDDVGDVFIVLTIMSSQAGLSVLSNIDHNYEFKGDSKHTIIDLGLNLNYFSRSLNSETLKYSLRDLGRIAFEYDYTLEECVQLAYNDIKDRKGLMHNGVFIKESDPAYASVVKSIEENYSA
ncbi:putative nucleoside triphosphate pyrophosphohydrolase [Acinetobacter phage AB_SZL4]|nr:MazG-like family protein [Escherichia coli]YP_009609864.1 MazG-like pyrophosphatase [Acinetobacter phage AbP2]AYP69078.1 DNA binding protein [Acinetobacter phage vB_AbaM_IME512]QEA11056.1 hypothetical protein Abp9_56 [Acinetobacter phage Abp9]URY98765.1 putative nucleoside triphosphate pyrophosphohydrolase [Acinetobacter phage Arbor]WPJ68882.1 putative nucleoside triphosphate pyrophosphohydrolase [Acinetobacter phage AB_SZL4]ASJ78882.1 putative nucleoside triphosphate pyrophosphohydrolase 